MTSEVDEIERDLTGPVNNWLNNPQLLKFQRLVQIARRSEELSLRLQMVLEERALLRSTLSIAKMSD
jgi:hypothetical protein